MQKQLSNGVSKVASAPEPARSLFAVWFWERLYCKCKERLSGSIHVQQHIKGQTIIAKNCTSYQVYFGFYSRPFWLEVRVSVSAIGGEVTS